MDPKIFLDQNEYIIYKGSYSKEDIVLQENSTETIGTLTIRIKNFSVNSSNTNIFNVSYFIGKSTSNNVATYNANLLSLNNKNQNIGTINLNGTDLADGNTAGISAPTVQSYNVLGKSGIYKRIHRVIFDFRNNVREFYMIGNCCCAP
jgi:hypothetical protein